MLGKISMLHLGLCDMIGPKGPEEPDCIYLAQLASVAVDFAKHGECVALDSFSSMQERLKKWPDFMEKKNIIEYESKGVLGKLWRDLDSKDACLQFQKQDYETSVKFEYALNAGFLASGGPTQKMHSFLKDCYLKIVDPMTKALRKLMVQNGLSNESELFTSDLHFRMFDSGSGVPRGAQVSRESCKQEDAVENLRS